MLRIYRGMFNELTIYLITLLTIVNFDDDDWGFEVKTVRLYLLNDNLTKFVQFPFPLHSLAFG